MRFLVIGKTHPTPQRDLAKLETVCTGAIGDDGKLYRLYPVPFRLLSEASTYKKFEWIEAEVEKNSRDNRPESFIPKASSIRATNHKVDKPIEKIRHLAPHLVPTLNEIIKTGKDARTMAVCRILNPVWGWVTNDFYGKHEEIKRAHGELLFPPEELKLLQDLITPPRLLQVDWDDEAGNQHTHRLLEWEYYKVLGDEIRKGADIQSAERTVLELARKHRFRAHNGFELWGLFGTTKDNWSWVLGALYSFAQRDIDAALAPRLFEQ